MKKFQDVVVNDALTPCAGASVRVNIAGGSTAATTYSDDGVTTKSNPMTADSAGRFSFYVADGKYDLVFSGTGLTTWTMYAVEIVSENLIFPGGDLGAKITAAITALGSNGGIIRLAPGTHSITTGITITNPNIRILGSGAGVTIVNFTAGSGVAITFAPTTHVYPGPELSYLTIVGTSAASTAGVRFNDCTGFVTRDLVIKDFTGTGAAGLWEDSTTYWTERSDVSAWLYNNKVGWKVTSNKASVPPTMGYGRFHLYINAYNGQTAIYSDGGSSGLAMGDIELKLVVNMEDAATFMSLNNSSLWDGGIIYNIRAEQTAGTGATGFSVDATSRFRGLGQYNAGAIGTDSVSGTVDEQLTLSTLALKEKIYGNYNPYNVVASNPGAARTITISDPGADAAFALLTGGLKILVGAVDPSASSGVAAPQGSLYLRTNGSTSTTLYVKTASGNTAWTAK